MSIRFSRFVAGFFAVVAMALASSYSWAVFYGLGESKDQWGLKYDVDVTDAGNGKLNVTFTLDDEGRLKPLHSIELIALSLQTDSQGGRSYDVKAPLVFKTTEDGHRAATVQIDKSVADRAFIRLLTQTVDGRRQPSGGSYYAIPIKKYLGNGATPGAAGTAATPSVKVKK